MLCLNYLVGCPWNDHYHWNSWSKFIIDWHTTRRRVSFNSVLYKKWGYDRDRLNKPPDWFPASWVTGCVLTGLGHRTTLAFFLSLAIFAKTILLIFSLSLLRRILYFHIHVVAFYAIKQRCLTFYVVRREDDEARNGY